MTRFVILAALVAAIGGSLFGYDTGVISGAILFVRPEFGLGTTQEELVISAALVGATIGAIASGRLTDKVGRRAVLLGAAASFAVGGLASAFASGAAMLIVARVIVGAAIGVASYAPLRNGARTASMARMAGVTQPAGAHGWNSARLCRGLRVRQ